jgi:PAS domain S-box-containing protein
VRSDGQSRSGANETLKTALPRSDLNLLEQLGAGLAIVDPAGTVVLWNDDAARILGRSAEEAVGARWVDCVTLIRGDDTGGASFRLEMLRSAGWHGPMHVRTGDGRTLWLRAHIQPIYLPEFDGKPGWVGLFWDAHDPEGPLLGPEAAPLPYRDLFVQSPEALFLTDFAGTIIDANDAAANLLAGTFADLIGRSLIGFFVGNSELGAEAARKDLRAAGSLVREGPVQPLAGPPFPGELIASLAAQQTAGYILVRLRDKTNEQRLGLALHDLALLSRTAPDAAGALGPAGQADAADPDGTDPDGTDVQLVASKAIEIVASAWGAGASIAILDDPDGFSIVAGASTPEAIRATLSGVDPARSPFAQFVKDAQTPLEMDLRASDAAVWAVRARTLGFGLLRATPLWHEDHRIGAMVLLWTGDPPAGLDPSSLEVMGRHVGLAIGSAGTRARMRRDEEQRQNLAGWARIGGVVVEQMTDSIVTTDMTDRITALNPAGEHLYGFSEEDAVGLRMDEVIDELRPEGEPGGAAELAEVGALGYWHGRVVHRPLIGSLTGRHIVVDLSLTLLRDDRHKPAGLIAMAREASPTAPLDSEAAALSSLAVATGRARSRREVAEAALERLCEATTAEVGIIATWGKGGAAMIEASRGLSQQALGVIRDLDAPELLAAMASPGAIVALESVGSAEVGSELAALLARDGLSTGFLIDLRSRDESIGLLGLASRRRTWARPSDEVILQVAAQVVSALENARLLERLEEGLVQERKLTAQLETLMGLTLLPQGEMSESTLALFLLERIVGALGADGGFAVRRTDADSLRVVASLRVRTSMTAIVASRPADDFDFWRRLTAYPGASAFRSELSDEAGPAEEIERMREVGLASYAAFPVREGDQVVGAFLCFFSKGEEPVTAADERTIEAVGRIVSIAYTNVRMSEGLNEAAEHERRLTAELRALQELTLLGATTDDLTHLAQETIEAVVVSTGAAGGGYILVDPATSKVDPIVWVGQSSRSWQALNESPTMPTDWPPIEDLQSERRVWLSRADASPDGADDSVAGVQAVLPLSVEDRLAGVLHLEWSASPRVEQFDDHFLEPIARICSIGLANFRLRSELLHRAAAQRALGHRIDTLDELTRIGEEASSFEELAHRTVSLVREALGANGVCYLLIEPGRHFETHAVAGETGAFRQWLKGAPAKDAPGGSIMLAGGGSVLADFEPGQINDRVLPLARATGFLSFGAIPIRTGEELAGALLCFFDQPVTALPIDEPALDSVARIGGIALANFRLRERLVSSEERYRTLFEESPDALFVSALDGTVLDANEAAVRLYHVNRGEVLGRYFGQLISADEREMARRRQIVWAQGRGTFADRGRRPDGSEFPIEVEVRVVELGGQRRFLSLVRDLSDQERLTSELLQAQKMEAIGQLVSGVAHELNNPLAAIIAFSQLIKGDQRLPDDMKHDAGLLVQEADRTRRIVQNLLDFARQRPPERHPSNIGLLVRSVLELQSYALSTNRVQVVVEIPEDLPEVDLDRAQMQQVLLNLTINSIQAIRTRDRATQAHLWVSAEVAKPIRGSGGPKAEKLADDQQRVRITIRDDGPGVPESARGRLFDPFFTTKQPGEGTGLGLSVSFGIVSAHGGHLWYEPGPANQGSCFMIELPVRARPINDRGPAGAELPRRGASPDPSPIAAAPAKPAGRTGETAAAAPGSTAKRTRAGANSGAGAAAATAALAPPAAKPAPVPEAPPSSRAPRARAPHAPASEPAPPQVQRRRILALDDEPSIRAFLKKVLAASGMDCDPYQDGAQALEGLRDMNYDVMLIDHRMAGMSGTEFYEAAISFRPELAMRAVFMSGDVLNPELRGFATQRGIRLLPKPFDIDAVIRVVREAIAAAEEQEHAADAGPG